jgi:hypothetical protein
LFLIMECDGQPDLRAGGWVAGVGLASWFVAEAAGAYGDQVLADPGPGAAGPRAVGRELARLIFAGPEADAGIPAPLAAVIGRSGSGEPEHALETWIGICWEPIPAWRLRWPTCSAGITGSSLIPVTARLLLNLVTCCGGTSRSWPGRRSSAPPVPGTTVP